MRLIKPPFEHYRGIKHCKTCDKYIPPTGYHYQHKLYCDEVCRQIYMIAKKLKKLCGEKGLDYTKITTS
jgi:hypothetical protein